MEPRLASYLALSGILFTIGSVGVIFKRNAIGMFMCIELMLNAVNLTFVAFSRYYADTTGQLFVFMVMAVAAVAAVSVIAFFRNSRSVDVDDASLMKN
ncbi:MAG: NADH-quinone oxidoreductase subunit NuoK [Acidobacteria bacterium]|nr:NADH-quinone oxidoreductase subunit NuoK [Acidobacteriota bacterium]